MKREILEPESLQEASGFSVSGPTRFIFANPMRGGPKLAEVRAAMRDKGVVRISATKAKVFVDVDPGEPAAALISLDMIARTCATGLERTILSALGQVDAVLVGVDGRSDEETRKVAEAYADIVWSFGARDIELSEEEWASDRIHFSNARNLGRMQVQTPWVLVIDSDEYLDQGVPVDFRQVVTASGNEKVGAYSIQVACMGAEQMDPHRLARRECRWWSDTHNQLAILGEVEKCGGRIVQDISVRTDAENERRTRQRNVAVDLLAEEASKGNLTALYHLAKHRIGTEQLVEGEKLAQDFRFRAEVHGPLSQQRGWLALGVAHMYYNLGGPKDIEQAELWCLRSMLDEPRMDAVCLLGDLAEERGDLKSALAWYEMACTLPEPGGEDYMTWRTIIDLRMGRRSGIRVALGLAP
jgi:hypothetical protein